VTTEEEIARAVEALTLGALVVFPTETLYAIGCNALDPTAVERLCAVKQRPEEKGIAVLLADAGMLEQVTPSVSPATERLARAFWPGPLTLLVPARPGLPAPLVRDGKIGCRVSSHSLAAGLSRALGRPLACPSANPAGLTPAAHADEARAYFGDAVAVYLGGETREGLPSTLVDPGPPLQVLREGAIPIAAIDSALRSSAP
jgi:L-threonylcarbamoyladenylate synthase